MPRLPSLKALRAFEAAGRYQSFTRAGEELNVSQGAVSHQIGALERELGYPLFRRVSTGVVLSEKGEKLLRVLTRTFGEIAGTLDELSEDHRVLRISVQPAFTARWLLPRLQDFQNRHPRIDLKITATLDPPDFRSGADGAILGLPAPPRDHEAIFLMKELITPVCSPEFLKARGPFHRPGDLLQCPVISVKVPNSARAGADNSYWSRWFRAVGDARPEPRVFQECDTLNSALIAAEQGYGIAMADFHLVQEEIRRKSLVMPFESVVDQGIAYYLVTPKAEDKAISAFRDWIRTRSAEATLPAGIRVFELSPSAH